MLWVYILPKACTFLYTFNKFIPTTVESTEGKLWLFILPGYSPDLNPDESAWSHVKHHTVGKNN
jgi:transposase